MVLAVTSNVDVGVHPRNFLVKGAMFATLQFVFCSKEASFQPEQ